MGQGRPSHFQQGHKLLLECEEFVRDKLAERRMVRVCQILSTSEPTLAQLLDVGVSQVRTRERIEERVQGWMRSEGLIAPLRPKKDAAAAPPAPKPAWKPPQHTRAQLTGKSELCCEELQGVRIGQLWELTEPGGRIVRVRVRQIVRRPTSSVAYGRTPSGRLRALHVPNLVKGLGARLLEDAPSKTA